MSEFKAPMCPVCNARVRAYGVKNAKGKVYYKSTCDMCSNRRTRDERRRNQPLHRIIKKDYCEKCGFKAEHSCQLDSDHIDGNRQNNAPENIQTLCANCHRLKTYINKDGVK